MKIAHKKITLFNEPLLQISSVWEPASHSQVFRHSRTLSLVSGDQSLNLVMLESHCGRGHFVRALTRRLQVRQTVLPALCGESVNATRRVMRQNRVDGVKGPAV